MARFVVRGGGTEREPFGADARGLLMYGADGSMSAVLSRADRRPLGVERLETARHAPDAHRIAAFDSYLSYAGRWRVEGSEVVHTVELSLVPDTVGLEQRRAFALDGDTLRLTYTVGRTPHIYELTWTR